MERKIRVFFVVIFLFTTSFGQSQPRTLDPASYFTRSEIDQANTANTIDYLTSEERDIYLYTNLARMFPKKFYGLYRAFAIAKGRESELARNRYYTSLTNELQTRGAEEPVYPDKEMFELAKCWALESGEKGLVGHDREDCPKGFAGENCAYGYPTGLEIVLQLLIDEGIPDYGHRVNLFYPDWKGLGAVIRPHLEYRFCAVQNFARTNDVLRKEEKERQEELRKEREERNREISRRQSDFEKAMSQWDQEEVRTADVARSIAYLNDLEKDLYFYTNLMRLNPKKFKEVIWDKGPFFDQLASELEDGIRKENQYSVVSRWLSNASSQRIVVPERKQIEALRCVIEKFLKGEKDNRACFKLPGGWRLQTYYSQSNFNDVMNILLTPDDFRDIFIKYGTIALHKDEPSIKAIFTPN